MTMEKMRSCSWKLELGFPTNGLISPFPKALGPNCPKLVFRPQMPNVKALGSKIFFLSSSIKFCIKWALIFKFWVIFDNVMNVYSQKIAKKLSKIFFLVPFQICKFPLSLVQKKHPFFGTLKFKYLWNPLAKFKKWAYSEILSLRAFKWCKNQIILIKFQFWLASLAITCFA